MKKTNLFVALLAIASFTQVQAQLDANAIPVWKKNLVKVNLSSILLKNYVVQYERVLGLKSSVAFTFGISPNTPLPFKSTLMDEFGDNADARRAIESTEYTKYNGTLEYRFYTGKVAPKGFYIAPFVRYMNMELSQDYTFTPSDNKLHTATITSKFNGFGGGLLFGYQWLIKNSVAIDFWIAGPFYGPELNADFHGIDPIGNLNASDQANLKADIEAVDIPGYDITANVSTNTSGPTTVTATAKGPYAGIRGLGLCLAFRF